MRRMRIQIGDVPKGGPPGFPDLEEGMAILMEKIKAWAPKPPDEGPLKDLIPTPPDEGPPLPRVIEIKWPKALSRRFPKIFVP